MLSKGNVYYSTSDKNSEEIYGIINKNLVTDVKTFLGKIYAER